MKKSTIIIFLVLAMMKIQAQNYLISFIGTGANTSIDSVKVDNMTSGATVTLNKTDILHLKGSLGIETQNINNSILHIYPNPMAEQSILTFVAPESGAAFICIVDLSGRTVYQISTMLSTGQHSFRVSGISQGMWFLKVSGNNYNYSAKLINQGSLHGEARIEHISSVKNEISIPSKSTTATIEMKYTDGDILMYKGIAGQYSTMVTDVPVKSKTITFNFVGCTDNEGNHYATVHIGTLKSGGQTWMAENLKVGVRIDGNQEQTNNGIIEKYCYYDGLYYCNIFGGLYQWNEMMQYVTTEGVQGICPQGWHIPTNAEWTILTDYLGGEMIAGGKLKEVGTVHWWSPNTGATNTSGFTALPGGWRNNYGDFNFWEADAYFWSSTQNGATDAWDRRLGYDIEYVAGGLRNETNAFSVRCIQDQGSGTVPTVSTNSITNITETTATGGGNVTAQGSSPVTARGVCWSTSSNPTTSDSHTTDGSGTGSFTSNITGLTANTPYYVCAYAKNIIGTSYGSQVSFTTTGSSGGEPCPGIPTVLYEGKTYNTVQIGTQCWLKENLNVGTRLNGSQNQNATNGIVEKYCYDDLESNCDIYGGLYQWDEMMKGSTTPGVQGICPTGWHVPTDAEWTNLTTYLGGESIAGGKMKETGLGHWLSPNTSATNESGFTSLPSGSRVGNWSFLSLGTTGFSWSSSQKNANTAWYRGLSKDHAHVSRTDHLKSFGFSGRCLKDL